MSSVVSLTGRNLRTPTEYDVGQRAEVAIVLAVARICSKGYPVSTAPRPIHLVAARYAPVGTLCLAMSKYFSMWMTWPTSRCTFSS